MVFAFAESAAAGRSGRSDSVSSGTATGATLRNDASAALVCFPA